MKNLLYKQIIKPYEIIAKIVFFIAIYSSSFILYLAHDITLSPDFEKYINYFDFYTGNIDQTGLEQGNLYFFIVYLFSVATKSIYELYSFNEIINIAVFLANGLFFLYGCFGYIKLLTIRNFKLVNTYLIMSIVCFMPPTLELRMTMKPEILAFTFLGWVLYYLTKFSADNKKHNLFLSILILVILLNTKISISFMVVVFLAFEIVLNHKNLIKKSNIKYLLLLVLLTLSVMFESNNLNGRYLHETEHAENYNNQANLDFFKTIQTQDLINNPNRYFHSESFIAITLFDTFSDFFLIYWNSEYTELNTERKQFFSINKVPNSELPVKIRFDKTEKTFTLTGDFDTRWDDPNYIDETRMRFAFIISGIFYLLLIPIGIIRRKSRVLMFSPFIGLVTVSVSALGIFGTNNFDPLVADSVKTYYYSFFIIIGFIFLSSEILSITEFGKKIILLLLLLLFIFIVGFPFDYSQETVEDLVYKNSLLPICELNTPILKNFFNITSETICNEKKLSDIRFMPIQQFNFINLEVQAKRIPYLSLLISLTIIILNSKYIQSRFPKFYSKKSKY